MLQRALEELSPQNHWLRCLLRSSDSGGWDEAAELQSLPVLFRVPSRFVRPRNPPAGHKRYVNAGRDTGAGCQKDASARPSGERRP
jgi:hypothetical protein